MSVWFLPLRSLIKSCSGSVAFCPNVNILQMGKAVSPCNRQTDFSMKEGFPLWWLGESRVRGVIEGIAHQPWSLIFQTVICNISSKIIVAFRTIQI